MNIKALSAVGAAALALAGCSGSSAPNYPKASGVVASGRPLVGVIVTATDGNGITSLSSPSDASGNYSIQLKGSAPFVLTASYFDEDGTPIVLSSVIASNAQSIANINPLTALATQRLMGGALATAPSGAWVAASNLTVNNVQAELSREYLALQPLYAAFSVRGSEAINPMGAKFIADPAKDALDALLDVAHINVHLGTIGIGVGTNKVVFNVPALGVIDNPSKITSAAIASMQSLSTGATTTPIKNLIVVVGENHTFDAIYGGYTPTSGQSVMNLLSEGIIQADGTPGPNYSIAQQNQAVASASYSLDLQRSAPYSFLPQPTQIGIVNYAALTTSGGAVDGNFPGSLPDGPFQITKYVKYDLNPGLLPGAETGDPVHRFFQMWQQTGGDNARHDLFTWVAVNTGQGAQTLDPSDPTHSTYLSASNTGQGGELMGFVNMSTGDAPYFQQLAQNYALSDNYHQWIMGGTGMNFFALATGDVPVFNYKGATKPESNEIEDPTPMSGTANFYRHDGYQGGSYVSCADVNQPGVSTLLAKLSQWGHKSNCVPGSYYLVNNFLPAYDMNGNARPVLSTESGFDPVNPAYPAQTIPTIADALSAKGVTWKWYTGAHEAADVQQEASLYAFLKNSTIAAGTAVMQSPSGQWNVLGDALLGFTSIVTDPTKFSQLKGLTSFYNDVANFSASNASLPSVSFVVPKNTASGHPGYSEPAEYEAFLKDLIAKVQANPTLWAQTAIVVTTDEGGGHFDSGYIQNIDFFGDGPRIPMLVVSPYSRVGHIDHVYNDHSSILKFIERNWHLNPLTARSRDNLPNPVPATGNPYRPANSGPAIGDLMSMFSF